MEDKKQIKPFSQVWRKIYAYNTIGVAKNDGWTKIGETEQDVDKRIKQQIHTMGLDEEDYVKRWVDFAMYKADPVEMFHDHDFHRYLTQRQIEQRRDHEWFRIDADEAKREFDKFANREFDETEEGSGYTLRKEQQEAVDRTLAYMKKEGGNGRFLWNAKPRFGKTLTAYELVREMNAKNVLIVTNRPAIANSWYSDYVKFIAWQTKYKFVSDNESLRRKRYVKTQEEFAKSLKGKTIDGRICFESLQGLKGSVYFGGTYTKLEWIKETEWDLLIIDESHEGVDTMRSDRAFEQIRRRFTLYLSGTPFKAMASGDFAKEQIFNWSYEDEQEAKVAWNGEDRNPYEELPRLSLFSYKMSDIVREEAKKGIDLGDENGNSEYAFDLNEFFSTDGNGSFKYERDVRKWLQALTTQKRFPFSTEELRGELKHTMWLLDRVDSAKAMAKLLKETEAFEDYEIVLAAGDGRLDDDEETKKAYDKVKEAIATHDRTITLSVGQLTTGVTIPEWSAVMMLSNLKSATLYMQAAFRPQNPCFVVQGGKQYRKENAYVFDFDPARTLILFDEFANNLRESTAGGGGTTEERKANIGRLLNFFPVIAEDENGEMVELDAKQVLSIPRKIKSEEVVRRGFLSNFLFANISNIFGAQSDVVNAILNKLNTADEEKDKKDNKINPQQAGKISVDENGNSQVPDSVIVGQEQGIFGNKIYGFDELEQEAQEMMEQEGNADEMLKVVDKVGANIKTAVTQNIVKPVSDNYQLTQREGDRLAKDEQNKVDANLEKAKGDYKMKVNIAKSKHKEAAKRIDSEAGLKKLDEDLNEALKQAKAELTTALQTEMARIKSETPATVIERVERKKAEDEKKSVEDDIRAHLRGFARTIPSFIMAFDDGNLTLRTFEKYVESKVFEEVTNITIEEFKFLRDGGDREDENGEMQHFDGHLFDEVVFDDSIKEFREKRKSLANYFDETLAEDIFDYIPPQKNNQIFTPKWVVKKMVDMLEKENPGVFDDDNKTFADLYMKSGMYITEIVKRLYSSKAMKRKYPDDKERVMHILKNQVYGFAPSRIIYLIATHYILGFDETLDADEFNFRQVDTIPYAKAGTMEDLIKKEFGR